jgi:hypothetical protein
MNTALSDPKDELFLLSSMRAYTDYAIPSAGLKQPPEASDIFRQAENTISMHNPLSTRSILLTFVSYLNIKYTKVNINV